MAALFFLFSPTAVENFYLLTAITVASRASDHESQPILVTVAVFPLRESLIIKKKKKKSPLLRQKMWLEGLGLTVVSAQCWHTGIRTCVLLRCWTCLYTY